jgi:hypothetical protein
MTLLAPTLQLFFTERMANQRQASPATITSYRNTFRLLLRFMQDRTGKAPSALDWADLDVGRSRRSWTTSKPPGITVPAAATPAWPRCGRCSVSPRCAIPSTPN